MQGGFCGGEGGMLTPQPPRGGLIEGSSPVVGQRVGKKDLESDKMFKELKKIKKFIE